MEDRNDETSVQRKYRASIHRPAKIAQEANCRQPGTAAARQLSECRCFDVRSAAAASDRSWRAMLVSSIGRYIAWLNAKRKIRRGIEELTTHDDRMLADIGLSRGDVEYAARFGRLRRRGPDGVCL
jgi:uncharacterized protein YjiS (DUF1127 family)